MKERMDYNVEHRPGTWRPVDGGISYTCPYGHSFTVASNTNRVSCAFDGCRFDTQVARAGTPRPDAT